MIYILYIYIYPSSSLCIPSCAALCFLRLGMSLDSDEEEPQMAHPPRPRCARTTTGEGFV